MIRSFIQIFIFLSLIFGLHACTIFKKSIPKAVIIALPDTMFTSSLSSTAQYTKYTNIITAEEVVTAFLKGFKQEAKFTSNVTLQFNPEGADFILKLNYLRVSESSKTQKIDDPKSQYNGQEVILNSVSVSADFDVVNTKNPSEKITGCYNNKERSESETNKRDIGDLISGSNKDNSQYRTKLLNDKIGVSLSEDVGRRIWVPITRRLAKKIKMINSNSAFLKQFTLGSIAFGVLLIIGFVYSLIHYSNRGFELSDETFYLYLSNYFTPESYTTSNFGLVNKVACFGNPTLINLRLAKLIYQLAAVFFFCLEFIKIF